MTPSGYERRVPLFATAEVLRHVIALPLIFLGLALARWPESVAAFYANAYREGRQKEFYSGRRGVAWVRIAGLMFVGFGIYWVIVGTG
jgi:hypothetical protein